MVTFGTFRYLSYLGHFFWSVRKPPCITPVRLWRCHCQAFQHQQPAVSGTHRSQDRRTPDHGTSQAWDIAQSRESTKIGKAALPAENVLDDMSVEEQWAELILKEAQSHETTHISERIQSHLSWPGLDQ